MSYNISFSAGDAGFELQAPVAVLGKNIWGPDPSSFGRQQPLSDITMEPIKNLGGGLGKIWGACAPWPNLEPPLASTAAALVYCEAK